MHHVTAGSLALKASLDSTSYDSLELGHALTEDVAKELAICAQRHRNIFNEDEYVVGYVLAGDPLLVNAMRKKFYADLFLPSPRPNQAMFLYNKSLDKFICRLWTLPNAWTMAVLSELSNVDPKLRQMKFWCDAFYQPRFWEKIRKQHNIKLPSRYEFLDANREKLIKSGCKEIPAGFSEPFDFSKIATYKVIDPEIAQTYQ